jgi:hypothetical protein
MSEEVMLHQYPLLSASMDCLDGTASQFAQLAIRGAMLGSDLRIVSGSPPLANSNSHVLTPGRMFTFWAETHEAQVSVFMQL